MSKPYYGIKEPLPKGRKRATMLEAKQNSQIRYWGIHKVDERILKKKYNTKKKLTYDSAIVQLNQARLELKEFMAKIDEIKSVAGKKKFANENKKKYTDLLANTTALAKVVEEFKEDVVDEMKSDIRQIKQVEKLVKKIGPINMTQKKQMETIRNIEKLLDFDSKTEILKKIDATTKSHKIKDTEIKKKHSDINNEFKELKEVKKLVKQLKAPLVDKKEIEKLIEDMEESIMDSKQKNWWINLRHKGVSEDIQSLKRDRQESMPQGKNKKK